MLNTSTPRFSATRRSSPPSALARCRTSPQLRMLTDLDSPQVLEGSGRLARNHRRDLGHRLRPRRAHPLLQSAPHHHLLAHFVVVRRRHGRNHLPPPRQPEPAGGRRRWLLQAPEPHGRDRPRHVLRESTGLHGAFFPIDLLTVFPSRGEQIIISVALTPLGPSLAAVYTSSARTCRSPDSHCRSLLRHPGHHQRRESRLLSRSLRDRNELTRTLVSQYSSGKYDHPFSCAA